MVTFPVRTAGWFVPVFSPVASRVVGGVLVVDVDVVVVVVVVVLVVVVVATVFVMVGTTPPAA